MASLLSTSLSAQQAEIIRLLWRAEQTSRQEIARATGWSRAKVSNEVNALLEKGILEEAGEGESTGGRRPQRLTINRRLGYLLGVEIGATSIDLALSDLHGQILSRRGEAADVRNPPEDVLGRCIALSLDMLAEKGLSNSDVAAIGIGVPGPVDFKAGVLVAPPLMPLWENFPIRSFMGEFFGQARIVVDNDVNIMALGEMYAGDSPNLEHFIFVKVGTGIGAGVVSTGRIHRGANGCAGDIGHICVDKNGPVCRCGNLGCLEAMAAGPAIAERAMQAARDGKSANLAQRMQTAGGLLRAEDVSAALREGDRAAVEIVQTSGRLIGEALASLVNFFNPSHIFLGGGVAAHGDQLLSSIRQAVLQRSLPLATRHLVIGYSSLGGEAGVIGAVHLALEYLLPEDG